MLSQKSKNCCGLTASNIQLSPCFTEDDWTESELWFLIPSSPWNHVLSFKPGVCNFRASPGATVGRSEAAAPPTHRPHCSGLELKFEYKRHHWTKNYLCDSLILIPHSRNPQEEESSPPAPFAADSNQEHRRAHSSARIPEAHLAHKHFLPRASEFSSAPQFTATPTWSWEIHEWHNSSPPLHFHTKSCTSLYPPMLQSIRHLNGNPHFMWFSKQANFATGWAHSNISFLQEFVVLGCGASHLPPNSRNNK